MRQGLLLYEMIKSGYFIIMIVLFMMSELDSFLQIFFILLHAHGDISGGPGHVFVLAIPDLLLVWLLAELLILRMRLVGLPVNLSGLLDELVVVDRSGAVLVESEDVGPVLRETEQIVGNIYVVESGSSRLDVLFDLLVLGIHQLYP